MQTVNAIEVFAPGIHNHPILRFLDWMTAGDNAYWMIGVVGCFYVVLLTGSLLTQDFRRAQRNRW